MGIYHLNDVNTGGANQKTNLLLGNFPDRHRCLGVLLRESYPVTLGAGYTGAATLTAKLLAAACLGSFDLQWGPGQKYVAYGAVPGSELRNVVRFVNGAELTSALPAAGAAGTTTTAGLDFFVPCGVRDLKNGRVRAPGASQMKTVNLNFQEGPALNAGSSTNTAVRAAGNCAHQVFAVTMPDAGNKGTAILSYFKGNSQGLEGSLNPDGILVGAWDINAAYGAGGSLSGTSGANLITVRVGGLEIHRATPCSAIDDDFLINWVPGTVAIDDEVVIIYAPHRFMDVAELPTGAGTIRQESAYVTPLQPRGLYFPEITPEMARDLTVIGANDQKVSVLGTAAPEYIDNGMIPDHQASTAPLELAPMGSPIFTLRAGIIGSPGASDVQASLPTHQMKQVAAAAATAGTGSPAAKQAAVTASMGRIVRQMPGAAQLLTRGKNMASAAHHDIGALGQALAGITVRNSSGLAKRINELIGKAA